MRVLYLLRYYPTLSETFIYREIRALQARGVEVEVLALGARADGALQDELPDVVVHRPARVPLPGAGAWRAGSLAPLLRPKDFLRACDAGRIARRFDRIHAHFAGEAAAWAAVAGAVSGLPFGVTVHAADLHRPRPGTVEVLRRARPVVAVSEHASARLRDAHGVLAKTVRCGVDLDRYTTARPEGEGLLRVISVARDVPKKGLDLLAGAIHALEIPVALRLVSDAPRLASDRVQVGALPPSAIPAALAAAHLFALPCRVAPDLDQDGVPVALMEALAAGLPVITTPVGGIPELVDEAVGWLVPPDDPDALLDALRQAAANPGERARRGAAGPGRLRERGFLLDRQAEGLLSAWGSA